MQSILRLRKITVQSKKGFAKGCGLASFPPER